METARIKELERIEAIQRASLNALDQGVAMSDFDGHVHLLNDTGARLLGMTAEELEQRFSSGEWETYDEEGEVLPIKRRPLWITMTTGQPVHGAVVGWRRSDGVLRMFRASTEPVEGPDGTIGVVTAFSDITDERRAERRRVLAEAALESERARFEALVARSTDIVCVLDKRGRITYVSPAGQRLLGYDMDAAVGMFLSEVCHPTDVERVAHQFQLVVNESGRVESAEMRLRRADGSWCLTEVVATNRLDDPAVKGIVANVRDITERAEAAKRLAWQAFHDALTGLPNRALLVDRLQSACARGRRLEGTTALLFIDLDRFKLVNDTMGHHVGDELLVEVARRLKALVRGEDTVARLGGDEFVILVEGLDSPDGAQELAGRVNEALAQPILLSGGEVTVSASVGIAFDVDHRPETMLRDADMALYRAKDRGRNRAEVFDDVLRHEAIRRVRTEQLLRRALDEPDGAGIAVHYQPIVDLTTGAIESCEALLRVRDEDGELASPAELVAVAEETGLIVALGAGVLDAACAQLAAWRRELGDRAPAQVSVNIAARQLSTPDFDGMVARVLTRHGLGPEHLCVELTERTIIGADGTAGRMVERLHEMGIRLAVDDFGTGYSSLAYMKRFPIDAIKIDRSFVDGIELGGHDAEIVKAVISLGASLAMTTVAEGIETRAQLDHLRSLGCQAGQGYLFARPAPGDEIAAAIRAQAPRELTLA